MRFEFECRGHQDFAGLRNAQDNIGDYIDGFYNPQRLHSTSAYRSPIEFEIASAIQRAAA